MSLIVGQYYRGNPKQKPKQWGSVSTVQATVFNNAEKIGINPSNIPIAIPFWELAGNIPYNYGQLGNPTLTGSYNWQDDGLRLNYSDGLLTIPYGESLINNTAATAVFGVLINKNAELGSDALNIVNSLFGKGIYSYASLTPSYYKRAVIRIFGTSTDSTTSIVNSPVDTKLNFCFSWDRGYAETLLKGQDFFDRKTEEAYTDIIPTTGTTDVQIGGSGDAVFNMLCVVNDTVNSDFLIDNPYYLFQPPTFRTYFDLAEAGTTLSFTSINSNSDLNNNFLSAIRLLNPTNISCFTEISASIISGLVNIINGNDLLADSQITQASVQAIRKLIGQEISSLSQITDIVISTAKQFNLTDLNSLTEVTNVVFSVINQINNNDLLSNSQVINLAIDVIRQININSIESISNITEVVLSITGGIRGIDVEAQTEITSLALSILRVLKENNVESNSSVNEATLNVIHQLDFNNISSLSEITDIVTVAGSNIGIKDNNSLTQITQVILDIIKAVSPININIQSEIDNPVINVLRTLFSNTVNVISNVTSVGVTNISTIATGKVTITFSMAVPSISWSLE